MNAEEALLPEKAGATFSVQQNPTAAPWQQDEMEATHLDPEILLSLEPTH